MPSIISLSSFMLPLSYTASATSWGPTSTGSGSLALVPFLFFSFSSAFFFSFFFLFMFISFSFRFPLSAVFIVFPFFLLFNNNLMFPVAAIYVVERGIRVYKLRRNVVVREAKILPDRAIMLKMELPKRRFNYKAGQYIFINFPTVSKFEWYYFILFNNYYSFNI